MKVIAARNVNGAYQLASHALDDEGIITNNRNEATLGLTIEFPVPVTTVYNRPTERVLFYGRRDCNPFFHLMEGLWMLAGRRDVMWISRFNSNMTTFSDDGVKFHGAYGYRWRNHFGNWGGKANPYGFCPIDQLDEIVNILKKDPNSRRAVLQMWDPRVDLLDQENKKDVPCLGGDTLIQSPEGAITIKELAQRFSSGELNRWPVYAVNPETREQELQWCTNVWKSGRKNCIRLIFDDGSDLVVTPDHRLYKKILRGPKPAEVYEVEAGTLKVGDRLLATRTFVDGKGYEYMKIRLDVGTRASNRRKIHRAYFELMNGPIPNGISIHHENEVKTDNRSSNLASMPDDEHSRIHRIGDANPMRNLTEEQHRVRAAKQSRSLKENWARRKAEKALAELPDNHVIVAIEEAGEQDVFDFTVPGFHTALVGTGVVAHNCNTTIYFRRQENYLDMTVSNRSNDMVWGCYGANAVHMSMLQEYMAGRIGIKVGRYYQMSNNLHAYSKVWGEKKVIEKGFNPCLYESGAVVPYPMVKDSDAWDNDLYNFMDGEGSNGGYVNPFFSEVAVPVEQAWFLYKNKKFDEAKERLTNCQASDWRVACLEWIERHPGKKEV